MSKEHYIEKYYSTGVKNDFRVVTSRVNDKDPLMVIEEKDLGLWMEGNMPTYGGYKCSICGYQTVEYKLEQCPHCKSTMYTKHVGYKRRPRRK